MCFCDLGLKLMQISLQIIDKYIEGLMVWDDMGSHRDLFLHDISYTDRIYMLFIYKNLLDTFLNFIN